MAARQLWAAVVFLRERSCTHDCFSLPGAKEPFISEQIENFPSLLLFVCATSMPADFKESSGVSVCPKMEQTVFLFSLCRKVREFVFGL